MSEKCVLYRIRILEGGAAVKLYEITSKSITIGRGSECDIRWDDPSVSREHLRLQLQEPRKLLVRDLGSHNGTLVAGKRLREEVFESDVVLNLGNVVEVAIEFEPDESDTAVSTPAPLAGTKMGGTEAAGEDAAEVRPAPAAVEQKMTCPHCWHEFELDRLLAVARHRELLGDPVLGPEAAHRFLPSRFTPEGHAVDAQGMACPDAACPRCHLIIPHALMEKRPLFLSMIGAPGSGKSYLLTAMTWELRRLLPRALAFAFTDADSTCNQIVNEYERTLFMCADDEQPAALEKTEMQGRMYNQVRLENMTVSLPRPFMFSLTPQAHHPSYREKKGDLKKTLVLYDNAGEHFEPGMDSAANPGTQHLVRSQGLFFLFDPTQDPRFRRECESDDPQIKRGTRAERQEILLTEAVTRIKRYTPAQRDQRYRHPLIIVVTKFDIWRSLLNCPLPDPCRELPGHSTAALDTDAIMTASFSLRYLLSELCPELVSTAESFASKVVYVPVSALGHSPFVDPENPASGLLLVRPKNIKPVWATVPMLYMLAFLGLIPAIKRRPREDVPAASDCRVAGDRISLTVPGTQQRLEVPTAYSGRTLKCPRTGKWFRVPVM